MRVIAVLLATLAAVAMAAPSADATVGNNLEARSELDVRVSALPHYSIIQYAGLFC